MDMPVRHGGDLVVVAHGPDPLADVAARRLEGDELEADAAPEVVEVSLRVGPVPPRLVLRVGQPHAVPVQHLQEGRREVLRVGHLRKKSTNANGRHQSSLLITNLLIQPW